MGCVQSPIDCQNCGEPVAFDGVYCESCGTPSVRYQESIIDDVQKFLTWLKCQSSE